MLQSQSNLSFWLCSCLSYPQRRKTLLWIKGWYFSESLSGFELEMFMTNISIPIPNEWVVVLLNLRNFLLSQVLSNFRFIIISYISLYQWCSPIHCITECLLVFRIFQGHIWGFSPSEEQFWPKMRQNLNLSLCEILDFAWSLPHLNIINLIYITYIWHWNAHNPKV